MRRFIVGSLMILLLGCDSIQVTGDTSLLIGEKVFVVLHQGDEFAEEGDGPVLVDSKNYSIKLKELKDFKFLSPTEFTFRVPSYVAPGSGELIIPYKGGGEYKVGVTIHRAVVFVDTSGGIHAVDLMAPSTPFGEVSGSGGSPKLGTSTVPYMVPAFSTEVGTIQLLSLEKGALEVKYSKSLKEGASPIQVFDAAYVGDKLMVLAATAKGLMELKIKNNALSLEDTYLEGASVLRVSTSPSSTQAMILVSRDGALTPYFADLEGNGSWTPLREVADSSSWTVVDVSFAAPYYALILKSSDSRAVYVYDLTKGFENPPENLTPYLQSPDGGDSKCANPSRVILNNLNNALTFAVLCGNQIYYTSRNTGGVFETLTLPDIGNTIMRGEQSKVYVLLADGTLGVVDFSSSSPQFTELSASSIVGMDQVWVQH